MENEEQRVSYFPLGSVILLEGGEKRLIIIGRRQISKETGKAFDYAGLLFPEGYQDAENIYLFNHSDVERVFQVGLIDNEELNFQSSLESISLQKQDNIYLESKKRIETAIGNIREMNATISAEWKGQSFMDYLNTCQELEEKLSGLGQLLEKGNDFLKEYETSKVNTEDPLEEFRNLDAVRVEKAENAQPLVKPEGDPLGRN
jgi:hypothetical protein